MTKNDAQVSTWASWFVLLLGMLLLVSAISITLKALSAATIWYVLVPGTIIGLALASTGALALQVVRELRVDPVLSGVYSKMLMGLALGAGCGISIGLMVGNLPIGIGFGMLLGFPVGLGVWLTARRLTRR